MRSYWDYSSQWGIFYPWLLHTLTSWSAQYFTWIVLYKCKYTIQTNAVYTQYVSHIIIIAGKFPPQSRSLTSNLSDQNVLLLEGEEAIPWLPSKRIRRLEVLIWRKLWILSISESASEIIQAFHRTRSRSQCAPCVSPSGARVSTIVHVNFLFQYPQGTVGQEVSTVHYPSLPPSDNLTSCKLASCIKYFPQNPSRKGYITLYSPSHVLLVILFTRLAISPILRFC